MAVTVGDSVCLSDEQQAVAVREVAQVYELIKTQQPPLHHHHHHHPQQLAHGLLTEAMRALNIALSIMKHLSSASASIPANVIKAEVTPANCSASPAPAADVADKRRSPAKRRRISGEDKSSWVYETAVPHEDGYQWRKYGEKKIQGTHFTRSYFRCKYGDDKGCQATKQIQQKDNYPPMFQVTYSNDHTCNLCTTRIPDNNNNISLPLEANPNSPPDDNTFSRIMIKQEPQATQLPPPLVAAIQLDEMPTLHVYPEVPPTSKIYCSDIVAGTRSSNSSVISHHTDEFDHHQIGQQLETAVMEEALGLGADLDDPYFYDQNLLYLYENVMNYY